MCNKAGSLRGKTAAQSIATAANFELGMREHLGEMDEDLVLPLTRSLARRVTQNIPRVVGEVASQFGWATVTFQPGKNATVTFTPFQRAG